MSLTYVCHYGEVGLKGKNQGLFIAALMKNIRRALKDTLGIHPVTTTSVSRRILLRIDHDVKPEDVNRILERVFGLVYFSPIVVTPLNMDHITQAAVSLFRDKEFDSFAVRAKRSNKQFPFDSEEVNRIVGKAIQETYHKKVRLKSPDITCFIEILDKDVYIYNERKEAWGGLPTGVAGSVLVLLSGGMDSPVAAYYAMKRGARCHFLHFHSFPYTEKTSQEKVRDLIHRLNIYQFHGRCFFVPFAETQKEIVLSCPDKYRLVLYRRFMMRVAEKLASRLRINALVTGESLGQVASQTLENLRAVDDATHLPVLRPLIGLDKNEIMDIARRIGTHDISVLPHDDACMRFMPDNPVTKSRLRYVRNAERKLDIGALVQRDFEAIEEIPM